MRTACVADRSVRRGSGRVWAAVSAYLHDARRAGSIAFRQVATCDRHEPIAGNAVPDPEGDRVRERTLAERACIGMRGERAR